MGYLGAGPLLRWEVFPDVDPVHYPDFKLPELGSEGLASNHDVVPTSGTGPIQPNDRDPSNPLIVSGGAC
jgi:hypothetical protein